MENLNQLGQNLQQYLLDNLKGKSIGYCGHEVSGLARKYIKTYLEENNFNTDNLNIYVDKENSKGSWSFRIRLTIDCNKFTPDYITIGCIMVKRNRVQAHAWSEASWYYKDFEVTFYQDDKTLLERIYEIDEAAAKRKQQQEDMKAKAKEIYNNFKKQNNFTDIEANKMLQYILNNYYSFAN